MITGIDKQEILEQAFEAVKTFRLMSEEEVGALIAKTQKVAAAGEYELLRPAPTLITPPNPDWLGGDSPEVQALAPQGAG